MATEVRRSRSSIGPVRNPLTHEAVLTAAEQVLADRGYSGFSIDLVAKMARASKPTVYRWWKTKADLIAEVYLRQSSRRPTVPDLGSVHAELLLLCEDLWRMWRETCHGEAMRSLIAEAQQSPEVRQRMREVLMPARQEPARELLRRAIARGEIPKDADIELALRLMSGFHWYQLLTDDIHDSSVLAPLIDSVIQGMKKPRAATLKRPVEPA